MLWVLKPTVGVQGLSRVGHGEPSNTWQRKAALPNLHKRQQALLRSRVFIHCCSIQAHRGSSSNGTRQAPQPVRWLTSTSDPVGDNYDAIVVLAGGFTSTGGLPGWVTRRLDAAQDILQQQGSHCPILCLGGGTPHKPAILSVTGHVVHESTACAEYLIAQGVPGLRLLKEVSSYDTVGNGYFALTIHSIPSGWRRLSVITSDFHMPRSRAIFQHCFTLAGRTLWLDSNRFSLDYHAVHDDGLFEKDVLEARIHREQRSLQGWRKTCERLQTLPQLHEWLHTTHLCYAAARQHEFGRGPALDDVDDKALATY
ncbi:hypothetical protein WJX72_009662 [[Myrmecia] bisecta]|uniref:DUF218 domain-containing protein n=1 Tax=[Myrmecia] bisecta TaxID=41462 RepID=A0AAW1P420_9CHLO